MTLNDLARVIYEHNRLKGFWHEDRDFGMTLALVHSEISEALEVYREGKGIAEHWTTDGKPEGIPSELADVIIRVLDICGAYGIDIDQVLQDKIIYNRSRPYKHGKKV